MTPLSSKSRAEVVNGVFASSRLFFWVGVVATAVTGLVASPSIIAVVAAVGIAAVGLACLLASLRFYVPWLWLASWFVPFLLFAAISEPVRVGAISMMSVIFAYSLAASIMFGVLASTQGRLCKWIEHGQ